MNRGKFIVLYGINNLGKTTQAKMLVRRLQKEGIRAEYVKYPIYELVPTGPKINQILRGGKPQDMSEEEFQSLYTQNRKDFEPKLREKLDSGACIVAEDYTGTGLAWGVAKGAELRTLERQNANCMKEDVAILLDGVRFFEGKEGEHLHESNDELMEKCRKAHLELGEKYGWKKVSANQPKETVHKNIWDVVKNI